ncbi:MAG: FhaA domain-containing protein [Armatimonadota bacterium]
MDLLSRLEHALEGMVEGVFSRAFRTQLQPIEVAKRLTREVEDHRTVSVSATYVPNVYHVHLATENFGAFQSISGRLLGELEQYLREFTSEHNYQTVGPIAVRLHEDAELKTGEMNVGVENDAAAIPSAAPAPSVMRSYAGAGQRQTVTAQPPVQAVAPATMLEVAIGNGVGHTIPLTDNLTIGRGPENTITLADPGVSRHHAEIVWQEDVWLLRDRGSTNGTYVNDRRITQHTLRVGDKARIGDTVFEVK